MHALTYDRYGPLENLAWTTTSTPAPRRGELVVAVRRAALNPKDALFRRGRFRILSGRRFPKHTGLDFTGVVVESRSTAFATGDAVYGCLDEWSYKRGTLAEQVVVSDREAAVLPAGIVDDDVAGLGLAGLTALQALRDLGRVRRGTQVWIHGASGGVGTLAIQIAVLLGAHVTTTSSAPNLALCAELGAARALDYREPERPDGADVVFDCHGNLSRADAARALGGRGRWISTVPSARRLALDLVTRASPLQTRLVIVKPRRADLLELAEHVQQKRLRVVVDSRFPIGKVHEAFRVLESRRARGKVIVEVSP